MESDRLIIKWFRGEKGGIIAISALISPGEKREREREREREKISHVSGVGSCSRVFSLYFTSIIKKEPFLPL